MSTEYVVEKLVIEGIEIPCLSSPDAAVEDDCVSQVSEWIDEIEESESPVFLISTASW